jgi:hypothetical protein
MVKKRPSENMKMEEKLSNLRILSIYIKYGFKLCIRAEQKGSNRTGVRMVENR